MMGRNSITAQYTSLFLGMSACMTFRADSDQLPKKFFAYVVIGKVMHLGCLRFTATFANPFRSAHDPITLRPPFW